MKRENIPFGKSPVLVSAVGRKTSLFGILFLLFTSWLSAKEKPNVIYILTDQWRSTAFGYEDNPQVKTPHIDQFAKESVIFRNAVSVCPVCTPHRASLLTGRYPTSTGMFLNDLYLPEREVCMAEIFKSAGYSTAYYGKWHLDGHGRFNNVQPYRRQGFDYWKTLECTHDYNKEAYYENEDFELKYWEGYSPFAITADAGKYLEEISGQPNPFLLFISLGTPHFPHRTAPEEYKAMYPQDQLILRPNVDEAKFPNVREELQGYYAHCTATDKAIGNLMEKIKALGLYDNSIIIFTSDHGEMMGSHGVRPMEKQLAWDEAVKVPFLIRIPEMDPSKGKETFAPINTPDILPTMLSLAEIKIPNCIEGDDLSQIVKNPGKKKDGAALYMSVYPFATTKFTEYRGIRTAQYTYVKTPGEATMLFDNLADPYQMNNLVNQPASEKIQGKLDRILQKKLKAIGDADFKEGEYYLNKFGYDFKKGGSVPYNNTPGKITRVYTPKNQY